MALRVVASTALGRVALLFLAGLLTGSGWPGPWSDALAAATIPWEEPALAAALAEGAYPRWDLPLAAGRAPVPVKARSRKVTLTAAGKLDRPDTEYVLANDVVADGTAFSVEASGVTLNLNGHTVTYLNQPATAPAYGIHVPGYHRKDIAICNGRIVQGKGAEQTTVGCSPIYDYDASGIDIGGVEVVYRTPDTPGILLHWVNDSVVHHSTIVDEGSVVNNRHQGVAAVDVDRGGRSTGHAVHHNLIRGARQVGIRSGKGSDVSWNELHLDSRVTNSTGIYASGVISHNRISGVGVHPIGIWPGSGVKVHHNFVEVRQTRRGEEYGETGAACLRMTWGNDDVEVMHNTFILRAGASPSDSAVKGWGRALWVGLPKPEQRVEFHDNFIMAVNDDGTSKAAAIAVVCYNESPSLVFRNNLVASNWANVLLADSYGAAGGFPLFVGNTFLRLDRHESYRSIRSQYADRASTGAFIANRFMEGASRDHVDLEFAGKGLKEISFGWQVTIQVNDDAGRPVPGARLSVTDASNREVAAGVTDSLGQHKVDLVEYLLSNSADRLSQLKTQGPARAGGREFRQTPHTVTVDIAGRKVSRLFSVTRDMTVTLHQGEALDSPVR